MTSFESSSKQKIFAKIPKSARYGSQSASKLFKEEVRLLNDDVSARDQLLSQDLGDAFIQRINTGLVIGTQCELLRSAEDIPKAVSQFLKKHDLPLSIALQNTEFLKRLNWAGFTLLENVIDDESVSICMADYGIAETGSVVIQSGPEMPILLSFLASYQIVVLKREVILAYLEDYARVDAELAASSNTPRNTSLITGCSGTTDIEGVLVQGAHGPKLLHILVI